MEHTSFTSASETEDLNWNITIWRIGILATAFSGSLSVDVNGLFGRDVSMRGKLGRHYFFAPLSLSFTSPRSRFPFGSDTYNAADQAVQAQSLLRILPLSKVLPATYTEP